MAYRALCLTQSVTSDDPMSLMFAALGAITYGMHDGPNRGATLFANGELGAAGSANMVVFSLIMWLCVRMYGRGRWQKCSLFLLAVCPLAMVLLARNGQSSLLSLLSNGSLSTQHIKPLLLHALSTFPANVLLSLRTLSLGILRVPEGVIKSLPPSLSILHYCTSWFGGGSLAIHSVMSGLPVEPTAFAVAITAASAALWVGLCSGHEAALFDSGEAKTAILVSLDMIAGVTYAVLVALTAAQAYKSARHAPDSGKEKTSVLSRETAGAARRDDGVDAVSVRIPATRMGFVRVGLCMTICALIFAGARTRRRGHEMYPNALTPKAVPKAKDVFTVGHVVTPGSEGDGDSKESAAVATAGAARDEATEIIDAAEKVEAVTTPRSVDAKMVVARRKCEQMVDATSGTRFEACMAAALKPMSKLGKKKMSINEEGMGTTRQVDAVIVDE